MKHIPFVIVALLTVGSLLVPASTVTVFEGGKTEAVAEMEDPECQDIINITLPAECHIRKATMNVASIIPQSVDDDCPSCPGVWLGDDLLWQYNGTDYGHFGRQTGFVGKASEVRMAFGPEGGTGSVNITLPKRARMINATMAVNCSSPSSKLSNMVNLTTSSIYGSSLRSVGDVNGDGFDDILVSDIVSYSSEEVHLYFGGPALDNEPEINFSEGVSSDCFGMIDMDSCISGAGDLNADGYSDIIIGAPYNMSGSDYGGKVYIYFGGKDMDNKADLLLWPDGTEYYMGIAVSGGGDINGDGKDDVLVLGSNITTYEPVVNIYFGGASLDNRSDVELECKYKSGFNPYMLRNAGDVNGDGCNDFMLGDYYIDNYQGVVLLYYGGKAIDNISDVELLGKGMYDTFGIDMAGAGDVNTDGYDDILIGAQDWNEPRSYAMLFLGGVAMDNESDLELIGETDNDYFGTGVAGLGDINNDGIDDFGIGAPYYSQTLWSYEGAVSIFFGSSQLDGAADIVIQGTTKGSCFGYRLSGLGDMNGDGHRGFFTSDSGLSRIEVFDGVTGLKAPQIRVGASIVWSEEFFFNASAPVTNFSAAATDALNKNLDITIDRFNNSFADLEIWVGASSDGNITLGDLEIIYEYEAPVKEFTDQLNSYITAHKSDVLPGQNLSIPLKVCAAGHGALKLSDLYIMADSAPEMLSAIPDLELPEDTAASDLLDVRQYFKDDYSEQDQLKYAIESATNSSYVKIEMLGNQYLAADASEGDQNDNWTGELEVVVSVLDQWRSKTLSNPFKLRVVNVNDAPVITSQPPVNGAGGRDYSYQVSAADGDNDPLTFALTKKPENMTINASTGLISWVPSRWGRYEVAVSASDGTSTAVQEFKITVANRPPKVTNATAPDAFVNEAYAYLIPAVDEDGDPLSFALMTPIDMMELGPATGKIVWKPAKVGDFLVSVGISDGMDATMYDFTIRVLQGNRAPRFSSSPAASAFAGLPYGYDANATDADNDALTFQPVVMPEGMTIDGTTGMVLWTPSAAGNFTVRISVLDGRGGQAVQEFTVVVKNRVKARLEVTAPLDNQKLKGKAIITGKITKGTLEVSKLQIKIDTGEWSDIPANKTWTYTLDTAKLSNGKHTLAFRAYDGMDFSDVVNRTVVIDNPKDPGKVFIPGFGPGVLLALTGSLGVWWYRQRRGL